MFQTITNNFPLIIFIATFLVSSTLTKEEPKVTIAQGSLVGTTIFTRGGRNISGFLGIPYAAPPTGQLRFKSPQPPSSWQGLRNASQEGSACIQQFVLIEKLRNDISGSEDCLYLNVYTPSLSQTEKFPVMFFIHGGGYAGGSGGQSEYGPELLLDRDVVLVAINYRLGALGFLSTGDSVLPGNLGLKDQLAALKWVQKNIEHFGGDKNSVTIFGESAGGSSVHLHMLSTRSQGLFHAAVSHSGTALCPWAFSFPARHKQLTAKLAQLVDCPHQTSQQLLDCLMALPAEKIVGSLKHFIVWDMDPVVLFNPTTEPEDIEDAFLTSDPWTLTSRIPWMVGFNKYDGGIKVTSLTAGDVQSKFKKLNDDINSVLPMSLLYESTAENPENVTKAIVEFYLGKPEKITLEMAPELIKMYTDAFFTVGSLEAARHHSGPLFFYHFAYNNSRSFSLCNHYFNNPQFMGVCHFDELMYMFPMDGHAPRLVEEDPDFVMSKNMIQLWTSYAKNKIPKLGDSKGIWESNDGSKEKYLLISKEGFTLQNHLLQERDQFWQNLPFRVKPPVNHPQETTLNEEF